MISDNPSHYALLCGGALVDTYMAKSYRLMRNRFASKFHVDPIPQLVTQC